MTELLRRAQELLAIEDIYLRDAHVWTHAEFDPMMVSSNLQPSFTVQIRVGTNPDVGLITSDTSGGKQYRVLYAVDTGLRLLKPEADAQDQSPPEDAVSAEINATFLVRYLVHAQEHPAKELIEAFSDNVIHHMWPYWREFLQATTARLRLPPIVLPMRTVRPPPRTAPDTVPEE